VESKKGGGFQAAKACSCEDPMQSVSASSIMSLQFLFYNLLWMAAKDVSWSVQFFQIGDKHCSLDITELLEAWVVPDFQDKGREVFVGSAKNWWPKFLFS
jgi:hypothetical protein